MHRLVSYRGAGLTLNGTLTKTLTRPDRAGRFPLVVLAHGYRPPRSYEPLEVSRKERIFLARNGFVVLHPDYRKERPG